MLAVLKKARQDESDNTQKDLLKLAIALIEVNSKDNTTRLSAIELLGNSLYPAAKGKLSDILSTNEQGEFIEQNQQVLKAAQKAMTRVESGIPIAESKSSVSSDKR